MNGTSFANWVEIKSSSVDFKGLLIYEVFFLNFQNVGFFICFLFSIILFKLFSCTFLESHEYVQKSVHGCRIKFWQLFLTFSRENSTNLSQIKKFLFLNEALFCTSI